MPNDAAISIRIEGDLKNKIDEAAKLCGKSTSNLVSLILYDWVAKRSGDARVDELQKDEVVWSYSEMSKAMMDRIVNKLIPPKPKIKRRV
jgi:hypothetical protein